LKHLNKFFNHKNDFYYNFAYSSDFIKNKYGIKKTSKGVRFNKKLDSFKRDKETNFLIKYINSSMYKGNKLTILKHFNVFVDQFYYIFIDPETSYKSFTYYEFTANLLKFDLEYYDFKHMLAPSIPLFENIFEIKIKKMNKKLKKLHPQKKFIISPVYLNKRKRYKNVLKLFNVYTHYYKYYRYSDRLLLAFLSIILDPAKSAV